MSYNIDNEAYSFVGSQSNEYMVRNIVSYKDKLYLHELGQIFEMNKQYEVLDTIQCQWICECFQKHTNEDDMIFMLDNYTGDVYCFSPFGEIEFTKVQDLSID